MSAAQMKPNTIRGLFAMVLLIGLLQILHIYQNNYRSEPSSSSDSTFGHHSYSVLRNQPPANSKHELLLRKLSVYRAGRRVQQNPSRVILDMTLLAASNDRWTRHTGITLPLREQPETFLPPKYNPMIQGVEREKKGYLTFGIPTVRRPNTDKIYIFETLDSLVANINEAEKLDVTLVVLLADGNSTYNRHLGQMISERYRIHMSSGFIRVIETPVDIYPSLEKIKPTLNDPIARVKWRAKQNVDFAFLHLYCRNISEYYIQIEDDVISSKFLIRDIKLFTKSKKQPWFLLEFSGLGFIGKMFHSSDLSWMANVLLTYFDQLPCDLFLGKMRVFKGQTRPIHLHQSLFQHIGKFSSLKNKIMPTIDDKFKDRGNVHLSMNDLPAGINPNVTVETNLNAVKGSTPMDAYNNVSNTFFWVSFPVVNSYVRFKFERPFNFSRIIVTSGDADTKHDNLKAGTLQYSSVTHADRKCSKYKVLCSFVGGEIDTQAMGISVPVNMQCLKIVVTQKSRNWVKFRNIILL